MSLGTNWREFWRRQPKAASVSAAPLKRRIPSGSIAIMGILLLVPALFVAGLQYKSTNEQVDFNRKELSGTAYMRPLNAFVYATLKYRVISSAVLAGQVEASRSLADALVEASAALDAVDAVDGKYGGSAELRTKAQWALVKRLWLKARSEPSQTPAGALDAYTDLDDALEILIRDYVGNRSNLLLDPDIDSYWLMEALIIKLPLFAETIASSHQLAVVLAREGDGGDRHAFELAGLAKSTQTLMAALETVNFRLAFEHARETTGEDALRGALARPLAALEAASAAHVASTKSLYASRDARTASNAPLLDETLAALRASWTLSDAVDTEISRLIDRRVERYQARRTYGVLGSVLTLLLLTVLYVTFYRAVRRSMTNLGRAHDRNALLLGELEEKHKALAKEKELRERFVSLLAHDLRGPLSVSRMGSGLLLEKLGTSNAAGPDTSSLLRMVVSSIDRTDQMIRDLLDAHRADSGQPFKLTFEKADLSVIVHRVVDELKVVHGERFSVEPMETVVGHWDPSYVQRALWNLMTNAVKYGAKGTTVTIAAKRGESTVAIAVHNLGDPIPPADLPHIFKPFARANSTRQGATGWGLGLTFVRGCAEGHGGSVRVQSSEADGTTFTFELPIEIPADSAGEIPFEGPSKAHVST